MKKKIALLLAAVMVVGSLPMTAFASSDNYVSSIKTVEDGDPINATIFLEEFKGVTTPAQTVKLTLTNAKFKDDQKTATVADVKEAKEKLDDAKEAATAAKAAVTKDIYDLAVSMATTYSHTLQYDSTDLKSKSYDDFMALINEDDMKEITSSGTSNTSEIKALVDAYDAYKTAVAARKVAQTAYDAAVAAESAKDLKFTKISDTEYMAEFNVVGSNAVIELPIIAEADGTGDATITIEAVDSVVTSQTLKIANIAGGSTTTTISGTTAINEKSTAIKNIVITETTAGTLEGGKQLKLRLSNGFEFSEDPDDITVFPNDGSLKLTFAGYEGNDHSIALYNVTGKSETASTISFGDLKVNYTDDAEAGDECEVTVSGAGSTKQSVLVGTATEYGVVLSVEDKDLPTFYAGRYSDTETLNVTIKEGIAGSWINNRKATLVFPEGVEVMSVTAETEKNAGTPTYTIDENEVEIDATTNSKDKLELELNFELSVSPEFTGDIEATLTGSAVGDDQTVTVGTAVFPVTVDADVNELKIDYRNTTASDIVITEADAGVLKKGKTVAVKLDEIQFDGDPTVEVESGDMKIENVKVKDGLITFDVKTESQKEAAVIRISDIELYMQRSLPAGEYDLSIVATDNLEDAKNFDTNTAAGDAVVDGDIVKASVSSSNAIIRNYADAKDDATGVFDVDSVTVKEGYVTVVTAGRDQDDSTFTTTVKVTIGADKMYAGTKEIALDVPAYIANGYTMMPVRAVTEALSDVAIVRWDDPTDTVTITFGQRVISMTVGSNVMKINGVDVAMQAQCEITDSRAFIPLRDLGYALGLNDSKIGWDDATKTATLN